MEHSDFMGAALAEADTALSKGEFPVGCVIVHQGRILAAGARTGTAGGACSETEHAEMTALRRLGGTIRDCRAERGLTAYCTMEPCLMCYAAMMLHGIETIVYAYEDVMGGGTACDLDRLPALYRNAAPRVIGGILRERSLELFRRFFADPGNRYWRDSPLARYTLGQSAGMPSRG